MNELADTPAQSGAPGEGGTAALLVFPRPETGAAEELRAASDDRGHGPTSLFDGIGRLLGLDAPIRRWMLVDRLAALIALGIPAGEALTRLRDAATGPDERAMIKRAIERRDAGGGLADALAAAGGYPAAGLAALRAAPDAAGEATALADLAATRRRRLTLRYSAALGGAALTVILAVLLVQHRPAAAPPAAAPLASAPVATPRPPPAPAATATPKDLAPALGPGLAGAPPPLVGIVGRLPDDAVALVRMPSGRTRTLAVGAVFDGWTLASLDAGEAVFARAGQRVTVALPPADDQ